MFNVAFFNVVFPVDVSRYLSWSCIGRVIDLGLKVIVRLGNIVSIVLALFFLLLSRLEDGSHQCVCLDNIIECT
jgi:hypothetical protein